MNTEKRRLTFAYQELKAQSKPSQARYEMANREIATLKTLLGVRGESFPSGTVLDLGCGDRFLEKPFRELSFDYLGLDADKVDFEKDEIPVESNTVDIVISLAVLEHLRDPGVFLSESLRVLRPGGVMYVSTPNFQYDYKNFYNDPTHVKPYTPKSALSAFSMCGFNNISVHPGIRCKSPKWYVGNFRFWKAFYLLPFRGDNKWVPEIMRGHARSIFVVSNKPFGK